MSESSEVRKIDDQEAELIKKTAQAFRSYSVSGDARTETELIAVLNSRPTLLQRFFPTQGFKINQELAADQLQQIVKDRKAVKDIHQSMYMAATNVLANTMIFKLEADAIKHVSAYYQQISTDVTLDIVKSQNQLEVRLNTELTQAKIDFKDFPESMERAKKRHDLANDKGMASTEALLERLLNTLKDKIQIEKQRLS